MFHDGGISVVGAIADYLSLVREAATTQTRTLSGIQPE
jgi:hypothetical protein